MVLSLLLLLLHLKFSLSVECIDAALRNLGFLLPHSFDPLDSVLLLGFLLELNLVLLAKDYLGSLHLRDTCALGHPRDGALCGKARVFRGLVD